MDADVDRLIRISVQLKKLIFHQAHTTVEERTTTSLQLQALSYIEKHIGANSSDVAEALSLSLSSTTQLIERLHESGYVTRKNDENDRRIVHISVTSEGIKQLHTMKGVMRERMRKVYAHIDPADIKTLIRIQEKLLANLKKAGENK